MQFRVNAEPGLKRQSLLPSRLPVPPRAAFALCLGLLLTLLCGCAAKRMRMDFTGFEGAYAQTSNQEVLLNLARLANHDPTYFFKLGQISTSYRMQAGLTGTGSYIPQGTTGGGGNATGGGTPSFLVESNPSFTFIPVNDDTNARLLLDPVPPEMFYLLYQQGWRVDQLFRLLVDRIELTEPQGNGPPRIETIRNTPPIYPRQSDDLNNYVRFLRIGAILYGLQKRGYLIIRGGKQFEPDNPGSPASKEPEPKDMTDAANAGKALWGRATNQNNGQSGWYLGQEVFRPYFKINGNPVEIEASLKSEEGLGELPERLVRTILETLTCFSIEGNPAEKTEDPCKSETPEKGQGGAQLVSAHLVMRSLIGLMAAAAQEQPRFDALVNSPNAIFTGDPLIEETVSEPFRAVVPAIERQPLLRLTWDSDHNFVPDSELIFVRYGRQHKNIYMIANQKSPAPLPENQFWNLDVFRLISELQAQVTVDISKFPLPEILQLRTD